MEGIDKRYALIDRCLRVFHARWEGELTTSLRLKNRTKVGIFSQPAKKSGLFLKIF